MADAAVFYYDLASPDAYLAAERVAHVLGGVPRWEPVLLGQLSGGASLDAFRCGQERDVYMVELERRAAAQGVQPIRWPPGWPSDTRLAMTVAAYAREVGRVVAFSLAAFRQAFAAGRDLADPDTVLIAAAACEMHPAAVLKAAELRSVAEALATATTRAVAAGVVEVPAVQVGERLFQGPRAPEEAAVALAGAGAPA
jgi:2-hydroxychromene-2-carboxylate isomerase